MEAKELLSVDAIVPNLRATSKKQTLQELAKHTAALVGEDERKVFDVLLARERLGTTGVGGGLAIPHGKLAGLDRLYGMFARLAEPVDFDAIDDRPVDLVFLLLAPEDAGADHLKALARISRMMRNPKFCEKLRGADSRDALYALLSQADDLENAGLRAAS